MNFFFILFCFVFVVCFLLLLLLLLLFLIIQSQAAFVNCLYVARFTIVHSKTQIKFPLLLLKVKNDHRSEFSNFTQLERRSLKKNQGFNGIRTRDLRVAGALLYQLSYQATHWEQGQFIEFISPVRSEMMRNI